jgi:hypothetical protein
MLNRTLKARWTIDAQRDLSTMMGDDIEDILASTMAEEIKRELYQNSSMRITLRYTHVYPKCQLYMHFENGTKCHSLMKSTSRKTNVLSLGNFFKIGISKNIKIKYAKSIWNDLIKKGWLPK